MYQTLYYYRSDYSRSHATIACVTCRQQAGAVNWQRCLTLLFKPDGCSLASRDATMHGSCGDHCLTTGSVPWDHADPRVPEQWHKGTWGKAGNLMRCTASPNLRGQVKISNVAQLSAPKMQLRYSPLSCKNKQSAFVVALRAYEEAKALCGLCARIAGSAASVASPLAFSARPSLSR